MKLRSQKRNLIETQMRGGTTASMRSMANPQDDCDRNLEVDIHPKTVQVVNHGPQSSAKDIETLKAYLDSKLQAQNKAFCKYKETQECKIQILRK